MENVQTYSLISEFKEWYRDQIFFTKWKNETIFLYCYSLNTFYVGTWYVYHNFLPFTKPSDKAFITRSSTWGWKKESYNKIGAKRGQTNIHNTVQIICSYNWKKVLRQHRYKKYDELIDMYTYIYLHDVFIICKCSRQLILN